MLLPVATRDRGQLGGNLTAPLRQTFARYSTLCMPPPCVMTTTTTMMIATSAKPNSANKPTINARRSKRACLHSLIGAWWGRLAAGGESVMARDHSPFSETAPGLLTATERLEGGAGGAGESPSVTLEGLGGERIEHHSGMHYEATGRRFIDLAEKGKAGPGIEVLHCGGGDRELVRPNA